MLSLISVADLGMLIDVIGPFLSPLDHGIDHEYKLQMNNHGKGVIDWVVIGPRNTPICQGHFPEDFLINLITKTAADSR